MKTLLLTIATLSLISCGQNNTSNSGGSTSANETIVTQQTIDNGNSVEYIEPRYIHNGQSLKLWGYGEPFEKLGGAGMNIHRQGICVMLMGENARYVRSEESTSVPVGETGAILSNYNGSTVKHVGNYEFKNTNTRPQRSHNNSYYYPEERNYSITSITCKKDNGQTRSRRNKRNRRN